MSLPDLINSLQSILTNIGDSSRESQIVQAIFWTIALCGCALWAWFASLPKIEDQFPGDGTDDLSEGTVRDVRLVDVFHARSDTQ